MVASPPWRRGPQVRAPWHHGGHGAVDVVGPVAPPGRASGRGDAGVYTDRRKWPLGAVLGHLCTLLRRKLRRELRRVARAPQPPWCAGSAPSVAVSRLVGKTGSARAALPGWSLRRGSNPHKPPKSQRCAYPKYGSSTPHAWTPHIELALSCPADGRILAPKPAEAILQEGTPESEGRFLTGVFPVGPFS